MIFNLTDGNGDTYEMIFTSAERVIGFAERSQDFTRPADRVTRVTFALDTIWTKEN